VVDFAEEHLLDVANIVFCTNRQKRLRVGLEFRAGSGMIAVAGRIAYGLIVGCSAMHVGKST
jgi:hypothetical protein